MPQAGKPARRYRKTIARDVSIIRRAAHQTMGAGLVKHTHILYERVMHAQWLNVCTARTVGNVLGVDVSMPITPNDSGLAQCHSMS